MNIERTPEAQKGFDGIFTPDEQAALLTENLAEVRTLNPLAEFALQMERAAKPALDRLRLEQEGR